MYDYYLASGLSSNIYYHYKRKNREGALDWSSNVKLRHCSMENSSYFIKWHVVSDTTYFSFEEFMLHLYDKNLRRKGLLGRFVTLLLLLLILWTLKSFYAPNLFWIPFWTCCLPSLSLNYQIIANRLFFLSLSLWEYTNISMNYHTYGNDIPSLP